MQVQSVSTDVNQLSGHGVGPRVERLAHRLIAAAHRGHQQHGQYGVQQPAGAAARQLPADPQEHPDDEPQQDRRPHPAEHPVPGGGLAKCSKAGQPHERGRRSCPPLGLVAEPDGQHSQQRPPQRKPEQHHTGEGMLFSWHERGGHQHHGNQQSNGQR